MCVYVNLDYGAEHAKNAAELCSVLHCNKRVLRQAIRRERLDGIPILASTGEQGKRGYYLPTSKAEYLQQIKRLRKQERALQKARKAIVKSLRENFGHDGSGEKLD